MKILERGPIILSLIGFLMKILKISGGNELLMIGLTFLAIAYFYLGFALLNDVTLKRIFKKSSYSNANSFRILGAIEVGVLLSIVAIGLLFKLLILTGAIEMLTIGIVGLVITLFAAWIRVIIKKKQLDAFYMGTFIRGGIAVILGIILYLTPASSLIRFYHRDDPAYAELFVRAVENPYDEKVQNEFEEAREKKHK